MAALRRQGALRSLAFLIVGLAFLAVQAAAIPPAANRRISKLAQNRVARPGIMRSYGYGQLCGSTWHEGDVLYPNARIDNQTDGLISCKSVVEFSGFEGETTLYLVYADISFAYAFQKGWYESGTTFKQIQVRAAFVNEGQTAAPRFVTANFAPPDLSAFRDTEARGKMSARGSLNVDMKTFAGADNISKAIVGPQDVVKVLVELDIHVESNPTADVVDPARMFLGGDALEDQVVVTFTEGRSPKRSVSLNRSP